MKNVYLSGPIAGRPGGNESVFRTVASYLESQGFSVDVPHDITPFLHGGECPKGYRSEGARHAAACHLRNDLLKMLRHTDEVWMLPEWESSVGARLELQVATACGIPVKFLNHELALAWKLAEPEIAGAVKALQDMGFPPEDLTEPEKRTPDEWSRIDEVTVMDPDGWRARFKASNEVMYEKQGWDVPITREEWVHRMSVSSLMRKSKKRSSIQ